ncbi:MAG: lysoplasmalogenase [Bifidobacteriaceae bacterium]|jgi:uncharacterized membrane protein YhhN|nr:lysoplasmalogenase [Bifidobacteriaceae bacterium]
MLPAGLTAVGAIVAGLYVALAVRGPSRAALGAKAAAGLMFVAVGAATAWRVAAAPDPALTNHPQLTGFALLVLVGLVCGLLGDIGLDLQGLTAHPGPLPVFTLAGCGCFAFGHLLYISAVYLVWRPAWLVIAGAAAAALVISFGVIWVGQRWFGFTLGPLRIPIGVYAFLLALMACLSWACFLTGGGPGALVMSLGGTLFLASDIVLSGQLFAPGKARPASIAACLVTYYGAQFTIALAGGALL